MKKLIVLFILSLTLLINQAYSITITKIEYKGLGESHTNMILSFFKEYQPGKDWEPEQLNRVLNRVADRMTITGWFKNVSVTNISTNKNEAHILFDFQERISYTAWLGDLYVGLTKFNLWGKGKVVSFEVGPYRQLVFIQDKMLNFTPFSYIFELGAKEIFWQTYSNNTYAETKILCRILRGDAAYEIIPDGMIHLNFTAIKLVELTNNIKIDSYFDVGLGLSYDRTAGFPVINSGWKSKLDMKYVFGPNFLKTEFKINLYQKVSKTIHFSEFLHGGFNTTSADIPSYHMFSLRNIDGLHSLTQGLSGMIGNYVWDVHGEFRWAFWEVIPFLLIFDLQIEAVAFIEAGEARITPDTLGNPHFVYGGGLRFYMNTFVVRAEMGIDETGESSVTSSFSAAF